MDPAEILTQATSTNKRPRSKELVAALLALEKQSRRDRSPCSLEQLQGSWRLQFVTGKARSQGGFYVPGLLQVTIRYEAETADTGRVENSVVCGPLKLQVAGPIRLYAPRGVLAFDFTQVQFQFLARSLYGGPLRGGPASEKDFAESTLAKQAFFTYFWTSPQAIAARGRGGGLALWSRAG